MDWILASVIIYFSSVIMYLLIRKVQKDGVDTRVYSFSMFVIPLGGTFVIVLAQGTSFVVPLPQLIVILGIAVLFSYVGNYVSQKSILLAPNPAYSIIIFRSYVVLTSIVAIFLFGSEMTLKTGIAIAAIVCFSALIVVERKRKKSGSRAWIGLAFAGFFCYGFLALSSKALVDRGGDPILMLFYILLFVTLIMVTELAKKRQTLRVPSKDMLPLILIGIFSLVLNAFTWYAYKVAPNPGYVNAVNAASISLVAVFSIILFKDEFNWRKMIGILGVTAGLILMFLPI